MINIPTAIAASLIGAVVAGIISGVVNLVSLVIQYRLNRSHKQWVQEFQWRQETSAAARQLRRHTLQLNMSDPDTDVINELIKDLEKQADRIPDTHRGTEISGALDDIRLAHKRYQESDDNTAVVDLRTELIEATETTETKIDDAF